MVSDDGATFAGAEEGGGEAVLGAGAGAAAGAGADRCGGGGGGGGGGGPAIFEGVLSLRGAARQHKRGDDKEPFCDFHDHPLKQTESWSRVWTSRVPTLCFGSFRQRDLHHFLRYKSWSSGLWFNACPAARSNLAPHPGYSNQAL